MTPHHFIVATAGHVDHGKSALVKALTGIDPDRLPEEKARGITIDLGFAHLELPAPAGHENPSTLDSRPSTFSLGIVDVPGHEDFVKNMVAGVGSIDLALLVVAADDGWMPQTEEHLQILTYLGVTRAVVALSKIDLAEGREADAVAALREQLLGTPFADAPIVPTSVIANRGLEELKATLAQVLAQTPPPRDVGKPRLSVDRVFTLHGIGTVVTGTLTGGTFRRGQSVVIQPGGKTARIRSLQNHSRDVEAIGPGCRTAINLPDIAKGLADTSEEGVRRGEVITLAELGAPCDTWDVALEKSVRLKGGKSAAARPLKDGTLVRVHLGSGNFPARVILQESGQLEPGPGQGCSKLALLSPRGTSGERTEERGNQPERASAPQPSPPSNGGEGEVKALDAALVPGLMAQLRFERPVFAFSGDRFIVRDSAEQATLAGGMVLDPDASRKGFRSPARSQFLRDCGSVENVGRVVNAHLARDGAVRRATLLLKSRFSPQEIADAVGGLAREGQATLAGEWVAAKPWWEKLCRRAAGAIDAEHAAHPERAGLAVSELRAHLEKDLPAPELFEALAAELCASGFAQAGVAFRRATHRPALPPHLQAAGARLRAALAARPVEPPARKELAPDIVSQQALRFLLQTGEAIELGEDVVLLMESFVRMKEAIVRRIREKGPATVSDLRQLFGTTRRIMMPLLDRLDRDGVTVRQGDLRILRGVQTR
ncbi:MAG TPA: selenocysteine-specific translation elongation factor [Verrucomicrobiae bacterium]|jgi:selenocysteine-specific elongation factor